MKLEYAIRNLACDNQSILLVVVLTRTDEG